MVDSDRELIKTQGHTCAYHQTESIKTERKGCKKRKQK